MRRRVALDGAERGLVFVTARMQWLLAEPPSEPAELEAIGGGRQCLPEPGAREVFPRVLGLESGMTGEKLRSFRS